MRGVANVMRRTLAVAGAALAALLAAGCGPQYVYFRPAEGAEAASPGWVAKGTYRLPPGIGTAEATLSARGSIEKNKGGVEYEQLAVRFVVRNKGQAPWTMDPKTVRIIDDDNHQVAGAEGYAGRDPAGTISIAGGADEEYALLFALPPGVRFQRMGSFRIIWPYRYGQNAYEASTKFLKIEEVNYYYPDYYYGYGPYGPYYYDPWYYGPWYGPWPYGDYYEPRPHRRFR